MCDPKAGSQLLAATHSVAYRAQRAAQHVCLAAQLLQAVLFLLVLPLQRRLVADLAPGGRGGEEKMTL